MPTIFSPIHHKDVAADPLLLLSLHLHLLDDLYHNLLADIYSRVSPPPPNDDTDAETREDKVTKKDRPATYFQNTFGFKSNRRAYMDFRVSLLPMSIPLANVC
jgi:hypothetical protein